MLDVFFYEAFEEEEQELKKLLPSHIKADFTPKTIQETNANSATAKIISVRTQSIIPPDWSKQLNAILTRSTGYDHLIKYLEITGKDLSCGYLPFYCNRSVAEHAMLLWMVLLKKLPRQIKKFNNFDRDGITSQECKSKKITIYGVGKIGYEIYKIAKNLEMDAYGVDINPRHNDVKYISKDDGLDSDIIVCAMNLTKDNDRYFNYDFLRNAKKSVIFINISRGELSPTSDMLKLLEEGHLGALGLDVYEEENLLGAYMRQGNDNSLLTTINKLQCRDNVILTPHNAFNTIEAVKNKSSQSIDQLINFLENNEFLWQVPQNK